MRGFLYALFIFCIADTAMAQDSPVEAAEAALSESSERARALYVRATLAFEAEEWAEAAELYERSYEVEPHPELLYNLALSQERNLADEQALATYRAFIEATEPGAPMHDEAVSRANTLQTRLRGGSDAGAGPINAPEEPTGNGLPIALVAVGGVALAAAVGTLVGRLVVRGDLNEACANEVCLPEAHGQVDRYNRLGAASWALLGVGAAASLAGILLWSSGDGTQEVTSDGFGLQWRGVF